MDSDRHRTDSPCGEKVELLQARLGHVRKENENLRHLVEVMKNQCNVLQARVLETTVRSRDDHGNNDGVKHAVPVGVPMESAAKKTSRIFVKADSKDSGALTVEDGYQWRKYGQKVTKDNPSSPRAYFRCSMAPSGCPVKKKVQRLLEDRSFIVANYQGEHNHDVPHCSSLGRSSSSANYRSPPMGKNTCCPDRQTAESITRGSDVTLDLTLSGSNQETRPCKNLVMRAVCDNKMKIEDYVASLTTDPTFTLALAEAVAASITEQLPSPQ